MTVSGVQERNPLAGSAGVVGEALIGNTSQVAEPASMVIFGITGDLSRKKLIPAIYDLAHSGHLPPDFDLVGVDRNITDVKARLRESVREHARTPFDPVVWDELVERIDLVQGAFDDTAALTQLAARLAELDVRHGKPSNYVFYLSVSPNFFEAVCDQLAITGLNRSVHGWRRVVVEKPFGHDLASSQTLGAALERVFPPSSIYRIDHYLGKETVQNILALRFANGMFEPLWNNRHIDHVQITMAESVGVTGRAGYYDGVGAARDVIQNHLLQLLALIAMEEPVAFDADSIAAEKIKVLCHRTARPTVGDVGPRPVWCGYRERCSCNGVGRRVGGVPRRLGDRNFRGLDGRCRDPPMGRRSVLHPYRETPRSADD